MYIKKFKRPFTLDADEESPFPRTKDETLQLFSDVWKMEDFTYVYGLYKWVDNFNHLMFTKDFVFGDDIGDHDRVFTEDYKHYFRRIRDVHDFPYDYTPVIIFAQPDSHGRKRNYFFKGVYRLSKIEGNVYTYTRISKTYQLSDKHGASDYVRSANFAPNKEESAEGESSI